MSPPRSRGVLKTIALYPLYPLLVNLFFVASIYQANLSHVLFADTLDYVLVSTAAWAALNLVILALARRQVARISAVLFFVYLYLAVPSPLLFTADGGARPWPHLIGGGFCLYILLLVFFVSPRLRDRLTGVFNALALLAVIWSGSDIVLEKMSLAPPEFPLAEAQFEAADGTASVRPNIVHIVLDGYSRHDVMRREYGHDNSDFLAALRARGFQVAERAVAPFNQTHLSLSATFLGAYLDAGRLARLTDSDAQLRRRLMDKVSNGPVHEVLKRQGYRFFATPVGLTGFYHYPSDTTLLTGQADAERWTFEHTLISFRNISKIEPLRRWVAWNNLRQLNRDLRFSFDFDQFREDIARALDGGTPIHLYQHVLAPHPPFTVSADGKDTKRWFALTKFIATGNTITRGDPQRRRHYLDGHLEKLKYTNRTLIEHIDRIVAAIPEPRVIIIQGDHGGSVFYDHHHLKDGCAWERFPTLFAIQTRPQAPIVGDEAGAVYNTVNIYRDVFAAYFKLPTPPLPSQSYFAGWRELRQFEPVDLSSPEKCPPLPGVDRAAETSK